MAELNSSIKDKLGDSQKQNVDFYYGQFYDIHIFVEDKPGAGFLYPVEKVWVVEDSIVN